jgi:hypothetical protein
MHTMVPYHDKVSIMSAWFLLSWCHLYHYMYIMIDVYIFGLKQIFISSLKFCKICCTSLLRWSGSFPIFLVTQIYQICHFFLSFREIKNFIFAKTFAKVSSFRKEFFAKTKTEFRENFREKTKAKTFIPILPVPKSFWPKIWFWICDLL